MSPVTNRSKKRLIFVFIVVCLLCTALTFRVGWIQVVASDKYSKMAVDMQTKDIPIPSKRGSIYDRNGNELAVSAATYSIWARPDSVRGSKSEEQENRINAAADKLSAILSLDINEVKSSITEAKSLVKVAKYVDKAKADEIRAAEISGIEIAEDVKRYYPSGAFASQLLGSVTDDNRGLAGLEMKYNNYLSGLPGRWIKDTDLNGEGLAYGKEKYYQAENGLNLVLTIDEVIQHYTEKALEEIVRETNADMVECVVMDPKTGDVLAMAALPEYDPNNSRVPLDPAQAAHLETVPDAEKLEYWNKMWRNPLVSDVYEPGSTFKLLTAAIALEEGLATPNSTYNCTGSIKVAGETIKCWRSYRPHGTQTLVQAVENSCNPVFVQLATKIGLEKYFEYMDLFGMTERTGIDYPGEGYSILQKKEKAWPVGLSNMAFGQGIAITPMQLITAICAIGNEGKLMQPKIVKEMTDEDGNAVEKFETKTVRKIISKQTSDEMCKIMESVVNEGGSIGTRIDGYRIGGKTGTAQKAENGVYSKTKYVSSSINMAPMGDPQIAVLVIVENPKTDNYYGSAVALPAGRIITEETLKYLNVKPNFSQEQMLKIEEDLVVVPSVTGLKLSEAGKALKDLGLSYMILPAGDGKEDFVIVDQYPKAGEKFRKETAVCLYKE